MYSRIYLLLLVILFPAALRAQTMIPLPSHASVYTGNIRGFWFTAPCDFVITGLRVPSQAGSGLQYIQVFRINDGTPVVYSTTSTNFTSLGIVYGATNGVIQTVNIPITAGQKIGIVGQAGTQNSYGTVSGQSNIGGYNVTLARIGYQGNMSSTGIANYWTEPASSSISRVEVYYTTCSTAVTQDPVSTTVCENQQAQFSVGAVDANVYQWEVNEGSGFFDVTNSTYYSGATTSTLSVMPPFSYDNNKYRCKVYKGSSASACADTTTDATLTVHGLVDLEDLPKFDTTCIAATKDIELKGTGSITNYKWQKYDPLSGTYFDVPAAPPYTHLGNILRISGVPDTLDGAKFRCVVDGLCDTKNSTDLLLSVSLVPTVAVPPADITADPGDSVTFEVQATASAAAYRWQVAAPDTFVYINDGGIYSGVKTNKLTVYGVSRVQNQFRFRCLVSTTSAICNAPADTSDAGILTVNPPASVSLLNNEQRVMVYPNPVKEHVIYIKTAKELNAAQYHITDKTGRVLISGTIGSANERIELNQFPAGIYMVEIRNGQGQLVETSRFTKL